MYGFQIPVFVAAVLSAVGVSATRVHTTADVAAKRDSCVYYCGSVCYWQEDIDEAVAQGYSLQQAGDTVGDNDYPHEFNNYEGFDMQTSAPWYEFPILSSYDVYTGGDPNTDRVIFNADGQEDILVTHTGASGNDFVACEKA
ncbi:ribonuclease-domain-containing protein [Xylariomycetidae sp. FL0641]|nr:ribonuclease-domain-containing protein [Xylariomycetidae sp. FL0641]